MAEEMVDNMGMVIEMQRNLRRKHMLEAIAAILVIILLLYVAYSVAKGLPSGGGTTTTIQAPANATITGLVSQLNPAWNTTGINSTVSNSSYNIGGQPSS